jgi:hypothetical protein
MKLTRKPWPYYPKKSDAENNALCAEWYESERAYFTQKNEAKQKRKELSEGEKRRKELSEQGKLNKELREIGLGLLVVIVICVILCFLGHSQGNPNCQAEGDGTITCE